MAKEQEIQGKSEVEGRYPRYLSNRPQGEDMYEGKSQERLADALAMHITDTDQEEEPPYARLKERRDSTFQIEYEQLDNKEVKECLGKLENHQELVYIT